MLPSYNQGVQNMAESTPPLDYPLLDTQEAAALLKINSATLQRLARAEEIPALKIGKLWRFSKSALDEWMRSKVSCFRHPCRK
jgi:excisionase family DNA binding protein